LSRTLILALSLCWCAAHGAEQTYMDQVRNMVADVELAPTMRDYCAKRSPWTATIYARLYDAWSMSHRPLLDAVADQVSRADARLKRSPALDGDKPFAEVTAMVKAVIEQSLDRSSANYGRLFCNRFPEVVDSQSETMIQWHLSKVIEAEKALPSGE
jgi:histidine ammonia-lyase